MNEPEVDDVEMQFPAFDMKKRESIKGDATGPSLSDAKVIFMYLFSEVLCQVNIIDGREVVRWYSQLDRAKEYYMLKPSVENVGEFRRAR